MYTHHYQDKKIEYHGQVASKSLSMCSLNRRYYVIVPNYIRIVTGLKLLIFYYGNHSHIQTKGHNNMPPAM